MRDLKSDAHVFFSLMDPHQSSMAMGRYVREFSWSLLKTSMKNQVPENPRIHVEVNSLETTHLLAVSVTLPGS